MADILSALSRLLSQDDPTAPIERAPVIEPEQAAPMPVTGGPSIGGEPTYIPTQTELQQQKVTNYLSQ